MTTRWTTAAMLGAALVLASGLTGSGDVADAQPRPAKASKPRSAVSDGRPPLVPHDVEDRKAICQECHATGEQGAPITPHPTRTHFCVQCHVGQDPSAKPFTAETRPR